MLGKSAYQKLELFVSASMCLPSRPQSKDLLHSQSCSSANSKQMLKLHLPQQMSAVLFVVQKDSLEQEVLAKNGVGDTSRTIDNLDSLSIKTVKEGVTSGFAVLVSGNAEVGSVLNEELIKQKLVGISESQFESAISEFGGVDVAELDIRPYWSSKIPTDTEKINITIKK